PGFIGPPVSKTSGGTGTPARTFGARSSRTSQRIIESDRSLFDIYGKNELLAKSPSPTITTRKGLFPVCPSARPSGQVPSTATPKGRRPGGRLVTEGVCG